MWKVSYIEHFLVKPPWLTLELERLMTTRVVAVSRSTQCASRPVANCYTASYPLLRVSVLSRALGARSLYDIWIRRVHVLTLDSRAQAGTSTELWGSYI